MREKVVPTNDEINFSIETSGREKFITYDSDFSKKLEDFTTGDSDLKRKIEYALLEQFMKFGNDKNFSFEDGDSFEIELGTCEVKTGIFKREPRKFIKVSRLAKVLKFK